MQTVISVLFVISAAVVAVPVTMFLVEVIAAIILPHRHAMPHIGAYHDLSERVAALVPAHNESTGLLPTLAAIKQQLRAADTMLVVANNCTDDTAAVASAGGADVVERHDPTRRGNG
jgi:hypothetical protein